MKKYKIKNIAGHLAKSFLNNPLTSILAFSILTLGYISLEVMPREEDPQIAVSGGSIIVPMPGASPDEINNAILKPLERRISEIKGIKDVYSTAMHNVGMLNIQYEIGEDRESSNLKLYDKVMQNMDTLPGGAMMPLVKPFDIDIDVPIVTVAFYKKEELGIDHIVLYKQIKDIQQDVNSIQNISKTTLKGAKKPQFNVLLDLDKLAGYHISIGQVVQSIQAIAKNSPEIDLPTKDNRLVLFGVKNAINSIEDLQNLIIAQYLGSLIYLKDIADVKYHYDIQNHEEALISYHEDGEPFSQNEDQVTMTVSKLKGTNAVTLAEEILHTLKENEERLSKHGIGYIVTRNYGERANEAVNELVHHLVLTIVIISLILIPFLGWRESLVVTIAVPMILAATLFVAYLTDQTINRITLFAFLLSLGLIVDDAIIVIENIHRHMHLKDSKHKEFDELIIEATDEIGPSTNIATIAIMLTMIPMAFVGGMMGQFMLPIPLNVPVGLAVSLFVAYVFTPFLAKKFIKRSQGNH
ncbi:MAG: efflux RND transporter permease subunit [Sulfurimonas sp.]|nr:efflux RND transporter permease subunit [Sulfurimonas sp.]MBU1216524.1 efflux RND transporter permease subunit [bacterium]MBU1433533.1 efflux RND transporter permease subunit [bacterium]MBU1503285.1 efflux RND transporter permease subunit [bacterium]MBU3938386.1 efflux RND transporter permease subunit [bacterium]